MVALPRLEPLFSWNWCLRPVPLFVSPVGFEPSSDMAERKGNEPYYIQHSQFYINILYINILHIFVLINILSFYV